MLVGQCATHRVKVRLAVGTAGVGLRFTDELIAVKTDLCGDGRVLQPAVAGGRRRLPNGQADGRRGGDDGYDHNDQYVAAFVSGHALPCVLYDEHDDPLMPKMLYDTPSRSAMNR